MQFDPTPGLRHTLDAMAATVPAVVYALVIGVLTYGISRVASGRLRSTLHRGGFQLNAAILLARALWLVLWIVGLLLVLGSLGLGLTPLAALVGVAGLAASLSLQVVLQNLVAGVYILAEHPFQIGDYISVVGPGSLDHDGRVEDIQLRTTHLRNSDDELILVPNLAMFSGVITNRTAVGGFVRHLTLTFPRQTELDDARQRLLSLLTQLPTVLTFPQPHLRVDTVSTDTWTGCLSLWARGHSAESDAIWAIARAFPEVSVNEGTT
ncbi:MAG: mechanosensitive ion channel family protein [Chloroflexota bacterium]|nr:mechanosensitive ion channel family protein [Chloroflexota bacterium]